MNMSNFLKQVDKIIDKCSKEQLIAFVHDTARKLPEGERDDFVNKLQAVLNNEKNNSNKGMDDNFKEIYSQLNKALVQIEEGDKCLREEVNEEYDEWYNPDVNELYYEDPENIFSIIVDAYNFVHKCIDIEAYKEAKELGTRLFDLEIWTYGEFGDNNVSINDLVCNDSININMKKLALDVIYAIYNTVNIEDKLEYIYDIICKSEVSDLCIENLMQHGEDELKEFEGFLVKWTEYLGNITGELAYRLFSEAIELRNDVDSAFNYAKKYVSTHPRLFVNLLNNPSINDYKKYIEIGTEGIKLIDKKYKIRSEVALKTAEYALCINNKKFADECYISAFESNTNAVNYLRVLLNSADNMDKKQQIQNILNAKIKGNACNVVTSVNSELSENILSKNMYYVLKFLDGQFMEVVSNGMRVKEALGWSSTFVKQGISLFTLYLYDGESLGKGIIQMIENTRIAFGFDKKTYIKGLNKQITQDDNGLFYECFKFWKNTVYLEKADKEKIVKKIEELIEKRVDGIMETNRRNYYGECALFIAALGEVKESMGQAGAKQKYMEYYRQKYSRRSAFKSELQVYGLIKM